MVQIRGRAGLEYHVIELHARNVPIINGPIFCESCEPPCEAAGNPATIK